MPESELDKKELDNDLRKTLGDWALRLFLNEGDRFWTRYYHCLLVNSFLSAGTAVLATSNASNITSGGRWIEIFALSVVAAGFNWLWTSVIRGGIRWHATYGRSFHEINRTLATQMEPTRPYIRPAHLVPKATVKRSTNSTREPTLWTWFCGQCICSQLPGPFLH